MKTELFIKRSRIDVPAADVFAWHERPGALQRLVPPWEKVTVTHNSGSIRDGARVVLKNRLGPLAFEWVAEHCDYIAGRQFADVQLSGPFAYWKHTHRVEPDGEMACVLEDHVEYRLPLGMLGKSLGGEFVHEKVEKMFNYRHAVTAADIAAHRQLSQKPLHIAVTGAGGFVASVLLPFLTTGGHRVTRLVRDKSRSGPDTAWWDPASGELEAAKLDGVDAVIHLAGESIVGRWNKARKNKIRQSRGEHTRLLCQSLAGLAHPPRVFVSASGINYYGSQGERELDEQAAIGRGFLPEVVELWEKACEPASARGIRSVQLRIGMVLSPAGGALALMLPAFLCGIGGTIGNGKQYMSWIGIDDLVNIFLFAIASEALSGPINTVTPSPVTNHEFTKSLGAVLWRPTVLPVPSLAVQLALGELGNEMLLASVRAQPARLLAAGYRFRYPELTGALRHLLGK